MPADCQIDQCGVVAVGRCHVCSKAFCTTQRALMEYCDIGGRYTDLCTACLRRQEDEQAASAARVRAEAAHEEQRRVDALTSLKAASNPGLQPRRVPGREHRSI